MDEKEVHLKLSDVKIDNDNLDYIKMTGEICGKLRDDLVKLFAIPDVVGSEICCCGKPSVKHYCKNCKGEIKYS